ncbi:hypothetical protein BC833DRAFT_564983 [Globomyces pollinis-pini]|nr:hypothetical protein BC833DRAFT_564983 [Globomyces pollinis-pini]
MSRLIINSMILLILLKSGYAASSSIVQFQWTDSDSCSGPPQIVYAFSVMDLKQSVPSAEEHWPGLFQLQMSEGPFGYCGVASLPVRDECCYHSLNLTQSNGYLSGRPALLGRESLQNQMPIESNGAGYCNITTATQSPSNYIFMSILSDGNCYEDHYRCFSNSSLSTYAEEGCGGIPVNYPISSNVIDIPNIGPTTYIKVNGGKSKTSWITHLPSILAVMSSWSLLGTFQNLCFLIAFTADLGLYIHLIGKLRKQATKFLRFCAISQIIWILHTVINAFYFRTIMPSRRVVVILYAFACILQNVATMCSALQTLHVFIRFYGMKWSGTYKLGVITALFIVHIIFAGLILQR